VWCSAYPLPAASAADFSTAWLFLLNGKVVAALKLAAPVEATPRLLNWGAVCTYLCCSLNSDTVVFKQDCRAAYRRSVTAARNSGVSPPSVSRDPVPPVERPDRDLPAAVTAMEFCRDILLALTKMTLGKEEHLASIQKEITTVLRRGENNYYKSVLDLKDEVLKIWKGSQR